MGTFQGSFFWGEREAIRVFLSIYLFLIFFCLNKLAKNFKILAHLVDFTQGKVESFQEKVQFLCLKRTKFVGEKKKKKKLLEAMNESA
jgi:hypothetical protein